MTRTHLLIALFLATALVGCSSSKPNLPPPPPHGGMAFLLPEAKGFVEALRREPPDQPGRTQLVIFFLDAERKPIAVNPASASFKSRSRGAVAISFKPIEDTDPSKSGGLASAPFDDPGEIIGELLAKIEGKPVSVPISLR